MGCHTLKTVATIPLHDETRRSSRVWQGRISPNDLKQRLGAFYKNLPVRAYTPPHLRWTWAAASLGDARDEALWALLRAG